MPQNAQPNSKLIAAAPALLTALKAALNDITLRMIAEGKDDAYFQRYAKEKGKRNALAQAIDAIELATGHRPVFEPAAEDSSSVSRWRFPDDQPQN